MDAALAKLRAAKTNKTATQVTVNDVLVSIIFFGTIACLTLLFIVKMA
ncbi:MAG: hypothetical protein AB7O79_02555 [Xanthobacteraceae bacterium]